MAGLCRLKLAAPLLLHLRRLTLSRSFGAAAAAQPQFNVDYHPESEYEPLRGSAAAPMVDSEGSAPSRGVQWVFIGNPGAKKHVYAGKLSKLLQVPHISIASLVRQDLHPRSSLYEQIANAVNNGKLVPENVIFGLLSERLEAGYYRGECGFILDGIPRSVSQAEILDQLAVIDLVVNFKCADDFFVEDRESGISSHCNECCSTNNSDSVTLDIPTRPVQAKIAKSVTTSKEGAWKGTVRVYLEQIKPLEDYYRKQKKLLNFQVGNAPGETWKGLLAALHLKHVDAKHSSQKLTAGFTSH
ncbi:hypothetical protein VitviT2T_025700 [Vitis vinifera]|uniref:adenylate kinase n=2 Tax=Vitis vinifera TaxID=29760 RepID=A0ABY9DJN7_VITVI|nr:probable adenylate kinase 7, mitochondrial [Vitis vinifera]RVW52643.1 putative adenylate kinase 7, mitochondrial [Vitis vinifera]WKA07930.1 hypothetical protein VitviT2T_025700 [Vitis vinifera]|eukprot:XP_002279733.1 PREDICTED: probable adenylate kinase 7, mitochondrial [Vitis vinifera]